MKTTNVLKAFGFEPDADNKNLYYRKAADNNHDVIKFMPVDELYNICMADKSFYFIDEKQLLTILTINL